MPGAYLTHSGWKKDALWHALDAPPAQSGRMVRALLDYYRLSDDRAALELAREIATYNARNCFEQDGSWKEEAGIHVHSITGTITSIIDLGISLQHIDLPSFRSRVKKQCAVSVTIVKGNDVRFPVVHH